MLTFDIAGAQIDGARDYQEDAFLITHLGDKAGHRGSLLIVADGMGGHAAGNVASNMAVQTFNKHITGRFPAPDLADTLRSAVQEANNSIAETVRETAALKGMGCTLVAAVVSDDEVHWVSVGDSHLYLVRDGEVQKKNADHSYGGFLDRMAAQGTPVEAESGFSRNMLMSALTGDEIADVDCPDEGIDLRPGDTVIIASDGLDTLSHGQILGCCGDSESARDCVESLLAGVDEAGLPKQDNTTIIVVNAKADPAAPKPVPDVDETNAAPSPAAPKPFKPASSPPPRPPFERRPPARRRSQDKSGSRFWTLLAVIVLVAGAGGAAYYFMNQRDAARPPQMADATPPEAEPTLDAGPESASASGPEAGPPPTASPAEPPRTETEVEAAPTFRDAAGGATAPLMAALPGGTFTMGSRASSLDFDEQPAHAVEVAAFAIGVTEITVAEYAAFARATGRRFSNPAGGPAATTPMTEVSWNDAAAYARWLSSVTGKPYRLPSEAEWEYAARAGTIENYWWGRNLEAGRAHCVACENALDPRMPAAVASFPPNPFGLFDTAGNVQEWVADCYVDSYEGHPDDAAPITSADCPARVVRGGSYASGPKSLRSAARDKLAPDAVNDITGFRVARDL